MSSMLKLGVKIDTAGIGDRILSRIPQAKLALAQAVLASSEPYVPYDTGELCRSGGASVGLVTWTAGHAAKCYYSRRPFRKEKHPQACAQWFEAARAVSMDEWRRKTAQVLTDSGPGKETSNV